MSLFVAVPAFGNQITSSTTLSLVRLAQVLADKGIPAEFGSVSYPDLVEVRNRIASFWHEMRPGATHLLFVDADMGFPAELVLDMLAADKPLVGAAYPKKRYPMEFVVRTFATPRPVENGYMEVEAIGTGLMLIRRDCLDAIMANEDIVDPVPLEKSPSPQFLKSLGISRLLRPFDIVVDPDVGRLSEDFSFCWRYRRAGGRIYANVSYAIVHSGQHDFVGCMSAEAKAIPKLKVVG